MMRLRNGKMQQPTRVIPLGLLADDTGTVLNLDRYALPPRLPVAVNACVIGIVGAGMNAGKTDAAAALIRGRRIAALIALASGQAAAGLAAIATREVFMALREPGGPAPLWPVAAIAVAGLAIAALRWRERMVAERLGQDYVADLRLHLFDHVARLPASDVAQRQLGALSLRFVGNLGAVRVWVSLGIGRALSAAIVLPALLVALDHSFGVTTAVVVGGALLVIAGLGPHLGEQHRRLRSRRARLAADVAERLPQAPALRLLGRLDRERRQLVKQTARLIDAFVQRQRRAALLRVIPDLAHGLAAAVMLGLALHSATSPATAAGALAALALMTHPLRDLAGVWDKYGAWRQARRRCEALLARPTLPAAASSRSAATVRARARVPPRVELIGVEHGVLRSLDLVVQPGEKIGISGGNGAGKSTLLALCAGLEVPTRGLLCIDGRPPTRLADAERQRMIAYAGPRSPILSGSLRRALTLGASRRPGDRVIATAARRFGLDALLDRADGLDGRISEGARNLSRGETQRRLLTRVALSPAPLVLLDEPDLALNASGAKPLRALLRERTATMIGASHDWSLRRAGPGQAPARQSGDRRLAQ